jgi:hypothetical protein
VLSNAYSTVHNNTLYYLHKKKIHDDRNKPTKARERDERGERLRIMWNSVGAANLTWWYLEEANKILSASPFNLYYRC